MLVYVLDRHGRPLMPCKPRKARLLLKEGKARVVRVAPFTIQLLYGSSGYRQPVYAGRDRGLTQGVAAVRSDGTVLLRAEVTGRRDISALLYLRRLLRRGRRYRNTRYRPCRSDNRKRDDKWLAPSVKHLWHEHEKVKRFVMSILPITGWAEEANKFDTRKLSDPGVKGKGYQTGPLKGKHDVREYVLERDSYRCVLCGSPVDREVHHIVWRFRGGSDRPKNLVTLCRDCHEKVTAGKIKLAHVYESYRWPARLNALNPWFNSSACFLVPAWTTKETREKLGLGKSHAGDALAVCASAFSVNPNLQLFPPVLRGKFVRSKNRQLQRAVPGKRGRARTNVNRYLVSKTGVRFMRYDLVRHGEGKSAVTGYINTLRSSGIVRLADWSGKELANASVNKLRKLQDRNTLIWEVKTALPPAP